MDAAYVAVTVVTILANAAVAIADFARAPFVLANAAEVRVTERSVPVLGGLKAAGAAGLAAGLAGVPWIGLAAGVGLVLSFIGAVAFHMRYRVYHNIGFPLVFLALAVTTLTVGLAQTA
jgi:DoxX-like family